MKTFECIKESYKLSMRMMRSQKGIELLHFDDPLNMITLTDGRQIFIVHDNNMVHGSGFSFACTRKISFLNGTVIKDFIFVDDAFMNAPKDVKTFAVLHECGHIINNDVGETSSIKRSVKMLFGNIDKSETNADAYAISQMGKMPALLGLYWLWKNIDTSSIGRKELKERIDYINLNYLGERRMYCQ